MIKRILVGLGGTPFTAVATRTATELGDLHQAQLTGVTIVDTGELEKVGPVPAGADAYAQRMREKKIKVTREGTEHAISLFKEDCNKQKVVCRRIQYEEGDTFEAMIAEARFNDLTIFGLRSIFEYGFVADPDKAIVKLLRQGVRPILAVAETYRPIKTVLIACSGSMESARATRDFLRLNPWPGASLRMVHYRQPKEPDPFLLNKAADYCRAYGYDVETDLLDGNPHTELLSYAGAHHADLIVMGNSSRNIIKRSLLGDTVLELIHSAEIPLFLSQ
jgi:nucleotide-binding universal stress UspA family protein